MTYQKLQRFTRRQSLGNSTFLPGGEGSATRFRYFTFWNSASFGIIYNPYKVTTTEISLSFIMYSLIIAFPRPLLLEDGVNEATEKESHERADQSKYVEGHGKVG